MKKYVRYIVKFFGEIIGVPLFLFSKLTPRNPKIWVFGEWHGARYADNSKYLFEYVSKHVKEVEAIWLTGDISVFNSLRAEGARVYKRWSLKGVSYALIAKFHIVTHGAGDTNPMCAGGAMLVNLTHGTPLKRLGKDSRYNRMGVFTAVFDNYIAKILPGKKKSDIIFCADNVAANRFKSAYPATPKIVPAGYPRWDGLLKSDDNRLVEELIDGFDHVFSFMPTLRFNNQVQYDPFSVEGFDDLNDFLKINNAILIIRPHPSMTFANEDIKNQNAVFLRANVVPDVFDILKLTDVLITDYSSVMYDYQRLARPILLLVPDLHSYLNNDVGIYGDFCSEAPGSICEHWRDVMLCLEEAIKDQKKPPLIVESGSSVSIVSHLMGHVCH